MQSESVLPSRLEAKLFSSWLSYTDFDKTRGDIYAYGLERCTSNRLSPTIILLFTFIHAIHIQSMLVAILETVSGHREQDRLSPRVIPPSTGQH
jgi:hypothetical protein